MPALIPSFAGLSSERLLVEIPRLASNERHSTAALVAALAVMDERKLQVSEGYPSLFAYCTRRLHLSEPAACRRIDAARASRAYPLVLERLAEGTLTLAAVGLLWKHLTPANHVAVLDAARHRSKREIEELAARLSPRPDAPSSIRRLPAPKDPRAEAAEGAPGARACRPVLPTAQAARAGEHEHLPATAASTAAWRGGAPSSGDTAGPRGGAPSSDEAGSLLDLGLAGDVALPPNTAGVHVPPSRPAVVRPLAPARYQITVTVSAETHAKLLRARDLLRHAIPSGDAALIVDRALTVLLTQLEKAKFNVLTPRAAQSPTASAGRRGPSGTKCPSPAFAGPAVGPGAQAPLPENTSDARRPSGAAEGRPEDGPGRCRPSGATDVPAPRSVASSSRRSRHIPAAVRRDVWTRSGGQCEFVSESGHRCEARALLEFHHRVPFAAGGVSTATNVSVRCRAHNGHEAELFFGAALVNARKTGEAKREPDRRNRTAPARSPSPATVNSCRGPGARRDGGRPQTG